MGLMRDHIRFFNEISYHDIPLVGGKNASLGAMYCDLVAQGVKVPNGFSITTEAYRDLLSYKNSASKLKSLLTDIDTSDVQQLAHSAKQARQLILDIPFSADLEKTMLNAYRTLTSEYGEECSVAVRSSATAEDLPNASFAGQQDSYLNVKSEQEYLIACKKCFASLFNDRAIHYRDVHGFGHFDVALSIGVMKMVRSDCASSGVMFSLDTESGFEDVVFITGAWGLGENIVQGAVEPDEFYIHKPTYEQGYRAVLKRRKGNKKIKMVYAEKHEKFLINNIATTSKEQSQYCLTDNELFILTDYAIKIEKYYSQHFTRHTPMDMEWAKDGLTGELYIVQARPETVISQQHKNIIKRYKIEEPNELPLVIGRAIGSAVGFGTVRLVTGLADLGEFNAGDILVADMTTPDWEPIMKKAAAIVTNRGGRTCHAAIIAREMGVPTVVGTGNATQVLKTGQEITVSCAQGDRGRAYAGEIKYKIDERKLSESIKTKTQVMLNIGNPQKAFSYSFLPVDGVGLARTEFIIKGLCHIE